MTRLSRGFTTLSAAALLSVGLVSAPSPSTAATSALASASDAAPAIAVSATGRQLVDVPALDALERAVAPSECGETLLDGYTSGLLDAMTDEQFGFLVDYQAIVLNVPTYEALFFGSPTDADFALESHAQQLTNTYRDLTRFWTDVQSDDIELMAMHGDVLLDRGRIARTLQAMVDAGVLQPLSPATIAAAAGTVADFMAGQGDFYDNPFFTLNAFAFSGAGDPDPSIAGLPDKLVFGDGILDAYDAIGLGDVGPRAIMAHEFGHHIQYELGSFDTDISDPAEATRRTELMADAFASYFGTHKKGLALNKKRVVDALLSFYTVGDCQFDSSGHHGTPVQRERAAAWGADLAAAAQPRSYVLPAQEVDDRFDAALPGIVAG